jgi:hypothetical protein
MRHKRLWEMASTGLAFVLLAGLANASDQSCAVEDGAARAGHPERVACFAVPTDTGHYVGYYVGGGAPCLGEPRCRDEGTWGWDYSGLLLPKRVILQWYHGRRYQGGIGAYRTVAPNCASKSTP